MNNSKYPYGLNIASLRSSPVDFRCYVGKYFLSSLKITLELKDERSTKRGTGDIKPGLFEESGRMEVTNMCGGSCCYRANWPERFAVGQEDWAEGFPKYPLLADVKRIVLNI